MPKGKYIDWSDWDHKLGVVSDAEIAKALNCNEGSVRCRRAKLRIHGDRWPPWTQADSDLFNQGLLRCTYCKEIKSLEDFSAIGKNKKTRTNKLRHCKTCNRSKQRAFRRSKKEQLCSLLGGKCQACGFQKHLSSLQFHHVELPKKFNPAMASYSMTKRFDELVVEATKCCLLCSNCHDAYHGGDLVLEFIKPEGSSYWTIKENHGNVQ